MKIKIYNFSWLDRKHCSLFRISKSSIFKLTWFGLSAFFFSLIFVSFPWTKFVGVNPDTLNYLARIDSLLIGNDGELGGMTLSQWIFSEPIWRSLLIIIGSWFYDPLNGLQFVSFFCIFTISFYLFSRTNNVFLVLFFLLNPMVVDLVMFQNRSALTMALCLIALMVKSRLLGLILIVIASLIHSITFILFAVYLCAQLLEKNQTRFGSKWLSVAAFFFAAALAVLLSHGRQDVLGMLGDRRAVYDADTISFLYLGFWVFLAFVLAFTRERHGLKECWGGYYSIVMLSLPFLMKLFGVNGIRFVALSFPFILPAILRRVTPVKEWLMGSLFVYQLVQYAYWLKIIR